MKKYLIALMLGLFIVGSTASVGCGAKQVDPNTERNLGNDEESSNH